MALADEKGIRGKDITPFLLATIKDMTEGVSFASNLQLAYNNARVASRIAVEFCKL
ncbi:MAG: pseudouridine-5'-phosphate glycosidase [Erysipelotrichaceae bacterium]|nr:pseudouridine-5'-phosphate glycosidase [Erysipelotrichaceae bacterium]